jgi:hypothetical protein
LGRLRGDCGRSIRTGACNEPRSFRAAREHQPGTTRDASPCPRRGQAVEFRGSIKQIFVATAIATWVCSLSSEKIDIASLSVIFPVLPQSHEWKLIARNLVSSHYVIA